MSFCFEFLSDEFNYDSVDEVVENFHKKYPQSWPCWSFSNHDSSRIASRIAHDPKELMAKLLSLKGTVCIYQGEELGSEILILHLKICKIHLVKIFGLNSKVEMDAEHLFLGKIAK